MAAVDRPVGAVIEAAVAKIGGVVDLNAAVVHGKPSAGTVRVYEHERAPCGGARVRAAHGNHRQRGGDCNCGADEKSLHLVLLPARYGVPGEPTHESEMPRLDTAKHVAPPFDLRLLNRGPGHARCVSTPA